MTENTSWLSCFGKLLTQLARFTPDGQSGVAETTRNAERAHEYPLALKVPSPDPQQMMLVAQEPQQLLWEHRLKAMRGLGRAHADLQAAIPNPLL